MKVSYEILILIMLFSGVAVLQFFRGRKLNLTLMDHYIRAIEPLLRPYRDRNFVLVGIYVGYKAEYKVYRENIKTFEYTLTLLPRESILYFPISLLTSRHDKIYFVIKPYSEIKRSVHVIQKGYYRLKPKIEEEEILERTTIEINGVNYEVLYEKKDDVDLIIDFLRSMPNTKDIKHISLNRSTNVFYILLRPRPENIKDCVTKIINFVNTKLNQHFSSS